VKSYGMDKMNTMINAGTNQMSRLFENPVGRAVITKIDMTIEFVDGYVEKYLPEDGEPNEQKSPVKNEEVDGREVQEQVVVFSRLAGLGCKVARRVYGRVVTRQKLIRLHAQETIDRLRFKTDLIELGRSYFHSTCNRICGLWQGLNKSSEQMNEETMDQKQTSSNLIGSTPVITTLTRTGSMAAIAVTRATRAAWYDVTKLTQWISATWTRRLDGTKCHGDSQTEEMSRDTNNAEEYEDPSGCDGQDSSHSDH